MSQGPDPNTAAMLNAVTPASGMRILDFACGVGVTSTWLALRGAQVTGVDITPESIDLARAVASHFGCTVDFHAGPLGEFSEIGSFDAAVGRFALHHVDVSAVAPEIAKTLKAGAPSAFLETMASNPVLRLARQNLIGRFGIPRYGTEDEHPLTSDDLVVLQRWLGPLRLHTAQPTFLRVLDRQILRYRWSRASAALGKADDTFFSGQRAQKWSYQQVLVFGGSKE